MYWDWRDGSIKNVLHSIRTQIQIPEQTGMIPCMPINIIEGDAETGASLQFSVCENS